MTVFGACAWLALFGAATPESNPPVTSTASTPATATTPASPATPTTPTSPASTTVALGPDVLGVWFFAERDVTVALYRSAGGLLQGKVTGSPRPAEVGEWILRDARWDARAHAFTGHLVTSDTGRANMVLTMTSPHTLQLVCSRLFLSKTLVWTRAATSVKP
jgi:hypothetical protein